MKKAEVPNAYMAEYDGFEKEWISTSALSCLMMCGIRFYYKYILREREPINIRMTSGSGTHKGREINLSQKIETQENLKLDEVKDATRDDDCASWPQIANSTGKLANNGKPAKEKLATKIPKTTTGIRRPNPNTELKRKLSSDFRTKESDKAQTPKAKI